MINFYHRHFKIIILAFASLISILYILFLLHPSLKVISSRPAPNESLDPLNPTIQIRFAQSLSSKQQSAISVSFSPEFKYRVVWESDSQLSLIPEDTKILTTPFVVKIFFQQSQIYSLPIPASIVDQTSEELDQQARQQGAQDLLFADKISQVYTELPFINKLPIATSKYIIVYDYDKKSIRVRLLNETSQESVSEEIAQTLQNIGVDTKKYPLEYKH